MKPLARKERTHDPVPRSHPVQPLRRGQAAKDRATCGHCGLSWDDGEVTGMTPTPSARCPFEAFHLYPEEPPEAQSTSLTRTEHAPKVYLSASEGRYRVIVQGVPVSSDRPTMVEALAAAASLGVKGLSDFMWDGDAGTWRPLLTRYKEREG